MVSKYLLMCLGRPAPETVISLSSSVLAARQWLDAKMDVGVLDEDDQVDNEKREEVEDGLVDEADGDEMEDVLDEVDVHWLV
jgi:hypothetical protein